MRIQSDSQLLGVVVVDARGRRLGRIVAVDCAAQDPYAPTWFVLRLRGWHHRLRAVPARDAHWRVSGSVHLPVPGVSVRASPALFAPDLEARSRAALAHFYAHDLAAG